MLNCSFYTVSTHHSTLFVLPVAAFEDKALSLTTLKPGTVAKDRENAIPLGLHSPTLPTSSNITSNFTPSRPAVPLSRCACMFPAWCDLTDFRAEYVKASVATVLPLLDRAGDVL